MWFATQIDSLDAVVVNARKYELSLVRQMLLQTGMRRVRCYDQPEQAIRELLQEASGLIIIDQDLPFPFSCSRMVRGIRQAKLVPLCMSAIIITSSSPTATFVRDIMQAGANSVLARPFSPKSLQMRVLRALTDCPKLENRDGRYVISEIVDTMEARELSSNPFKLAAVLNGSDPDQAFGEAFDGLIADAKTGGSERQMDGHSGTEDDSAFEVEWRKPTHRPGNAQTPDRSKSDAMSKSAKAELV